jgi:hypothetical protein
MPLVVPGINSNSNNNNDSWMTKLMGKKLSDSTSNETSFAKKDLPQNHRVVDADGGMMTMDHNPDRYEYDMIPPSGGLINPLPQLHTHPSFLPSFSHH